MITNDDLAKQTAIEEAKQEYPDAGIKSVDIYRKIVASDDQGIDRWYIEVDLMSATSVLYRVWIDAGVFNAIKIEQLN